MPEEMAVLDPVNADQPVETPGEPEREVAETEIQAGTESEEQEPSPSPIEGLPEEELENEPRFQKLLKDREPRLQESYRQRELAAQAKADREGLERAYLENAQRAANANWQWGHSYLQQVATEALNKGYIEDIFGTSRVKLGGFTPHRCLFVMRMHEAALGTSYAETF